MKNANGSRRARGFTLIELLVAMALFAVVAGAALSLFSGNLPVYVSQQSQAGLNVAVRNAIAQMQTDIVNAGYYSGINVPDFPIGLTIQNNVSTSACNTASTYTYGPNCFDQINVITTDKNTPPAHPTSATTLGSTSGDCTGNITTSITSLYVIPNAGTTLALATAQAADYQSGDELLLVNNAGTAYETIHLTQAGSVATVGAIHGVKLTFTALANNNGTNTAVADPLNITQHVNSDIGVNFCATDWILRLTPTEYYVNTTTASDPVLTRRVVSAGVNTDTQIAEQMVGLKIGAVLYNTSDDCPVGYYYDSSQYPNSVSTGQPCGSGTNTDPYDFTRVRAVRISMIARTTPETDPTYVFRNGFDGGPYQVEGVSVVVSPRNLTLTNP